MFDWQQAQQHLIGKRKDCRIRADAERQRQDRNNRKSRILPERSQSEADVLQQVVHSQLLGIFARFRDLSVAWLANHLSFVTAHSYLSATIGSTRIARRAGT